MVLETQRRKGKYMAIDRFTKNYHMNHTETTIKYRDSRKGVIFDSELEFDQNIA